MTGDGGDGNGGGRGEKGRVSKGPPTHPQLPDCKHTRVHDGCWMLDGGTKRGRRVRSKERKKRRSQSQREDDRGGTRGTRLGAVVP